MDLKKKNALLVGEGFPNITLNKQRPLLLFWCSWPALKKQFSISISSGFHFAITSRSWFSVIFFTCASWKEWMAFLFHFVLLRNSERYSFFTFHFLIVQNPLSLDTAANWGSLQTCWKFILWSRNLVWKTNVLWSHNSVYC